jgi:hypothetical protein
MALPTTERLKQLLAPAAGPCVSVYLPTHRRHPENQQDPIRFKNLVTGVEASLREKYRGRDVRPILEPFHKLGEDRDFWNHTLDGLAVLAAGDSFDVFPVRAPVPERVVVADSFHLKPLFRAVQTADHYHVLGLSRDRVGLWDGDGYGLDPIDPAGLPAPGNRDWTDPLAGTKGGEDADRFFRLVDADVLARLSKPAGVPLVLVGLTENTAEFRRLSGNPFLAASGVTGDPGSFSGDALRAAVWDVVLPTYLARLDQFTNDFNAARDKRLASADLSDVARAATEGRVGRLLIDADKVIPGTLAADGAVRYAELSNPEVDDLLDDLAGRALGTGAEVFVVPHDRMPADTGLAAVFRY